MAHFLFLPVAINMQLGLGGIRICEKSPHSEPTQSQARVLSRLPKLTPAWFSWLPARGALLWIHTAAAGQPSWP